MSKIKQLGRGLSIMAVALGALVIMPAANVSSQPSSAQSEAAKVGGPQFACDNKDSDGEGWVLPVYVHLPGDDKYDAEVDDVRRAVWQTDQTFDMSAHRFGVSRRLRVAQDDQCVPLVANLAVDKGSDLHKMWKAFGDSIHSQPASVRKIVDTKRTKMLFFAREDAITGECYATMFGNQNTRQHGTGVSLPRWCWGEAGLTHEILHTFSLSHCNQEGPGLNGSDPVCRGYGTRPECTSDAARHYHLDSCRTDDFRYFEPTKESQPNSKPLPDNQNLGVDNPYLIEDQPSPALDFRLRAEKSEGQCVDGGDRKVVVHTCSDSKTQLWRRSIDRDGYLTLRNLGTNQCMTMATEPEAKGTPVETAPCKAGEQSQQWLPSEDATHTNFRNRTGGNKDAPLSVPDDSDDGTPVTRGNGKLVAEYVGGARKEVAKATLGSDKSDRTTSTEAPASNAPAAGGPSATAPPVAQASNGNKLAGTGFNGGWLIVLGAVLLLGGGALMVMMRTRGSRR